MGKSLSYKILRGVRLAWVGCCSSCRLPVCHVLACGFRVSGWVVPDISTGDQDLLGCCADIVLKHGVLICSFEQIVHRCWGFLGKKFKEWCTRADASFKDLKDDVHATRLYLKHNLSKPLYEFSQWLVLLHLYVLQGTDVLLIDYYSKSTFW